MKLVSPPANHKKEKKKMSTFVKKYPALSMFVLAMIFGAVVSLAIATNLLPPEASQLGALSSSLAAIVLVLVEGRKGGLRELLGRFLIWRVGLPGGGGGPWFVGLPPAG